MTLSPRTPSSSALFSHSHTVNLAQACSFDCPLLVILHASSAPCSALPWGGLCTTPYSSLPLSTPSSPASKFLVKSPIERCHWDLSGQQGVAAFLGDPSFPLAECYFSFSFFGPKSSSTFPLILVSKYSKNLRLPMFQWVASILKCLCYKLTNFVSYQDSDRHLYL